MEMIRKRKLQFLAAVLLVILIFCTVMVVKGSPEHSLSENLSLGSQYLSELKYDQAIACYQKAVKIDPKCTEAYIGMAAAWQGEGDTESARGILQTGLSAAADPQLIQEAMTELENGQIIVMPGSDQEDGSRNTDGNADAASAEAENPSAGTAASDTSGYEGVLDQIAQASAADDYKSIWSLSNQAECDELFTQIQESSEPVTAETAHGTVQAYQMNHTDADGTEHIFRAFYCGSLKNGKKDGNAGWFCNDTTFGTAFYARGDWAADEPEGTMTLYKCPSYSSGSTDPYDLKLSGTVRDGLWDGDVAYSSYDLQGEGKEAEFQMKASGGVLEAEKIKDGAFDDYLYWAGYVERPGDKTTLCDGIGWTEEEAETTGKLRYGLPGYADRSDFVYLSGEK